MMPVTVLFLGPLQDLASEQPLSLPAPLDWDALLSAVSDKLAHELSQERINVACAGRVLADKAALLAQDGDEVALLPPVSGG